MCEKCRGAERAPTVRFGRHALSTSERGYDHEWRKLAAAFLEAFPLCHDCRLQGKVAAAEEVHHKQKIAEHPELRLSWDNLMALCKSCHSVRTGRGE